MPELRAINYELSDPDEAGAAIAKWDRAPIGNPEGVAYPRFEIDYIDLVHHDEITIWLKLKKED